MSDYQPSASRDALGFGSDYIGHPRSRWAGNFYWLVANHDAVPARIRDEIARKSYSPANIKAKVTPLIAPWEAGHTLRIADFGEPVTYRGMHVRSIDVEGPLAGSQLSLTVNADFLAWVERHLPKPGIWYLSLARGNLINVAGKTPQALLMPVVARDLVGRPRAAA